MRKIRKREKDEKERFPPEEEKKQVNKQGTSGIVPRMTSKKYPKIPNTPKNVEIPKKIPNF